MSREQIYVGSGAITMLLNGNFYTIDKNAYYFKPNTEYEKDYYVIFDKKLYKVQKRTSQSPIENPDAYIEQKPVDNHTKVALNDDIDVLQKQIDGSEEGTDHDLDEIKQKVDNLENDLNTNYLKIADFDLKLSETEINASQIKGILDVGNIPQTAIPCLTVVNTVNDMYQLTIDDVQIGDVIKVQEDDKLYFVVDDTKLNSSEGYVEFNASVDWSTIINKPEEFKPQAHKHDLTDINDSETLALKSEVETKLDKETYQQDQEKVVKYQEFTYGDRVRKTIQLNNYDSISGVGTDGHGYNIAMVSKWDKVDLGTASLTMNLNSKDGVVQINDELTIATLNDLASYVKSVDFEGYKTTIANDIASINDKFDEYALKVDIPNTDNFVTSETFNNALETVNSAIDSKAEKIAVDSIVENVNTINSKLETVVSYSHDDANNKETVLLKNHDSISGLDTNGVGYNLVMVSKWNKADFGSSGIQMNLNSLNGVVQINDDKIVATVDQIPDVSNFALKSEIPDITSVYKYKGSVSDTGSLPENAELGDVYNVESNGNNYAWDGSNWDSLGGTIDLSSYYNKNEIDGKLDQKQNIGNYVEYQSFQNPNDDAPRKTIQLANHDTISGIGTNGQGYNIAMVSKWDKVDLGTPSLTMNLNSKDGIVQINDDKTIATVDQIPSVDNLVTTETFNTNIDTINQALDSKADKTVTDGLSENIDTINNKFNEYALKSEIPDVSIYAKNEDLKYIADTVIPEMNTNTANALNAKVDWDSEKKAISLPKDGSISALRNEETLEGGNLLAQRTYDDGATFVTEVGTTKNKLTLNASERPQIDIQGQESQKVAFVSDIPNDVYYLGNFSLSLTAENKAKEDGIYNNINYKVLTYTVNNSDNGFIINNVASDKTTQFLNYKGVQYKREVVSGEATSWVEMETSIMLKGKAVNGIKLFKLTTDSTDTEIQEALSAGGSLITEDDLNTCLTKGYTLREYSMQSPSIFVGFTGQGFTLSYFGFANPSQDSALMSIVIAINDGVYSVLKNATRALAITTSNIATNSTITSLTDRIQELESTCPKMVNIPIRTLKDEVYSKEDILGWFGVEDDPALKKIISGLAPMYLRYGILLSGNPHYYKMPIQYIAYETANQVKMVVVGLDTSNDVVSKYEIILNLDGTIIEGNSNVKVTITALE